MSDNPITRISTKDLKAELQALKPSAFQRKLQILQELNRRERLGIAQQERAAHQKAVSQASPTKGQAVSLTLERPILPNLPPVENFLSATAANVLDPLLVKDAIDLRLDELCKSLPLREYQRTGVEFITRNWVPLSSGKVRFPGQILADDPGLGKTLQLFAVVALHPEIKFTVYLTKKTLIEDTAAELRRWADKMPNPSQYIALPVQSKVNQDKSIVQLQVQMARDFAPGQVIIVTNYESLNTFPWLRDLHWDLVVVDEAHKLKGGADQVKTKVWKNTKDLVWKNSEQGIIPRTATPIPNVDKYLFMTGTLINNKPQEVWAYLNIFDPQKFDDLAMFNRMFTQIEKDRAGDNVLRLNMGAFIGQLSPMMIRRRKEDVGENIPELNYIWHDCVLKPDQEKVYRMAQDDFMLWLSSQNEEVELNNILEQMLRMRQICTYNGHIKVKMHHFCLGKYWHHHCHAIGIPCGEQIKGPEGTGFHYEDVKWDDGNGKLEKIADLASDLVLFDDEQVVIFSAAFNPPLDYFMEHFASLGIPVEKITGAETAAGKVRDIVSRFQQGETKVLLANMSVAAEGLNLQKSDKWPGGASYAFLIDSWWNPRRNDQAMSRLHRLDTREPVFAHQFQACLSDGSPTVDHVIKAICDAKDWWHQEVTNNESMRRIKKADIIAMLKGEKKEL